MRSVKMYFGNKIRFQIQEKKIPRFFINKLISLKILLVRLD